MKTTQKTRKSSNKAARRPGNAVFAFRRSQLVGAAIIATSSLIALAATVPNTFTSGSPAVAADVNANFQALATALTTAEAKITALETKLASVSLATVNGQPTVRFSGVNVQVVNGLGSTATINGAGNLIVGYDEADNSATGRCSIGMNGSTLVDAANCTANGGTLSTAGFKTGSHYLVLGSHNSYSNYGGLVAGYQNFSNFNYASVSGGTGNTASGQYASVSGGRTNTASGIYASVSGGSTNTASGNSASVSGGYLNTASGGGASVSGGAGCTVSATYGWDVGGTTAGCSPNVGQ